jgi:hypothetical protein
MEEEAADCLIVALFNMFKEIFGKAAIKKGVIPNATFQVDIERVEAFFMNIFKSKIFHIR